MKRSYQITKTTLLSCILGILAIINSVLFVEGNIVDIDTSIRTQEKENVERLLQATGYEAWLETRGDLYDNYKYIGDESSWTGVHFHWKTTDSELQIAVIANATGWVGFGIAESGGMPGADMAIYTAVDDTLIDAHAVAYATPIPDECQNWELVLGASGNGVTLFEAIRPLEKSDDQDRSIEDDSHFETPAHPVISAWGDSETYQFHGPNRARGSVRFFMDDSDTGTFDGFEDLIIDNYSIPTVRTTYEYFCMQFNADEFLSNTGHIVGFSFLEDPDTVGLVHHALLFASTDENNCDELASDLLYVWAPGADDVFLPSEAGYRAGEGGYKNFIINVHYDNPSGLQGKKDSSGVRLFYSETLREFDAGVLQIGDPLIVLNNIVSPEVGKAGKWDFECPSSCLSQHMTDQPTITVFAEYLHMHQIGAKMESNLIRDGEIIHQSNVDYYDFDISGMYAVVQEPFVVEAGDAFSATCYYQSDSNVIFGLSSDEEMCVTFLMYYPALPNFNNYCGVELQSGTPNMDGCEVDVTYTGVEEDTLCRSFGTPCGSDAPCTETENPPQPIQPPQQPQQPPSLCRSFSFLNNILDMFKI